MKDEKRTAQNTKGGYKMMLCSCHRTSVGICITEFRARAIFMTRKWVLFLYIRCVAGSELSEHRHWHCTTFT